MILSAQNIYREFLRLFIPDPCQYFASLTIIATSCYIFASCGAFSSEQTNIL